MVSLLVTWFISSSITYFPIFHLEFENTFNTSYFFFYHFTLFPPFFCLSVAFTVSGRFYNVYSLDYFYY